MLSYAKSATVRPGDRLNGFENGKTQLFNSWGVGKCAYFQKKWSVPLRFYVVFILITKIILPLKTSAVFAYKDTC